MARRLWQGTDGKETLRWLKATPGCGWRSLGRHTCLIQDRWVQRHGHRQTLTIFSPPGSPRTCRWADACAKSLSQVHLFVIPRTVACQAPLSMEFSRQEHWRGLTFPSPGNFPDPRIEPGSLASPALAGGFFTTSAPWADVEFSNLRSLQEDVLEINPLFISQWKCAYSPGVPSIRVYSGSLEMCTEIYKPFYLVKTWFHFQ